MSYVFGEAFCLMWYACSCGHRERIWNSRDGVTPSGMGCPSCGEATLRHMSGDYDECMPDHQPHAGQGIWRDGTVDEAIDIMNARLDSCIGTQYEADAERRERILNEVRTTGGTEFQPGWPILVRYPPY